MTKKTQSSQNGYISVYAALSLAAGAFILTQTYRKVELRRNLLAKIDRWQDLTDLRAVIRSQLSCSNSAPASAAECTPSKNIDLMSDNNQVLVQQTSTNSFSKIGNYQVQAQCLPCTDVHCGSGYEIVTLYRKVDQNDQEYPDPITGKKTGWTPLEMGGQSLCQFDF